MAQLFYFLFEPWLFSTLENSPHEKFQNLFLYCVVNSFKKQENPAVFTGREQYILYLMLQHDPDLEEEKRNKIFPNWPQSLFFQTFQRDHGGKK